MDEGTTAATIAASERHIIERPRLTKILDESDARIILLVAPAGYGKTTLARQWLKDKPHVWYQATPASADPVALVRGLEHALGAGSEADLSLASLLAANPTLAERPSEIAEALAKLITRLSKRILVIDDFHLVDPSRTASAILEELTPRLHTKVVLTSRVRPQWITARAAAYGEVTEVGASVLAMTQGEAEELLKGRPAAEQLAAAAEGWPVLLSLAASSEGRLLPTPGPPSVIYDFLTEELLRTSSGELEDLVIRAAFAPSLTDALAVEHPVAFSEGVRLGLIRRDRERTTIHPLLAEFLEKRARDRPDADEYLQEIAAWLMEHAAWDEAFGVIEPMGRPDLFGALLSEAALPMLEVGRVLTVQRWLSAAREAGYHGAIADLVEADLASRRGNHPDAKRLALGVESRTSDLAHRCRALILAARSAYLTEASAEAGRLFRAAANLAQDETARREAVMGQLVVATEFETGDLDAIAEELKSLASPEPETVLRLASATMFRAGRFGPTEQGIRVAEEAYGVLGRSQDPWVRSSFLDLFSHLLVLSGDYRAAARMAGAALEEGTRAHFDFAVQQIKLHNAAAKAGLREYGEAARLLRLITAATQRSGDAYLRSACASLRLRLIVEQRLSSSVAGDSETFSRFDTGPAPYGELLTLQAMILACALERRRARELVLEAEATSSAIEVKVLAQAARAIAETSEAARTRQSHDLLRMTIETGNIDGSVIGVRASDALRHSVQQVAASKTSLSVVAEKVLALAFPQPQKSAIGGSLGPGSLSAREREVLELLTRGLTNKQIAQVLFISAVTVKVHLRHIYEKLGVQTRTQAALLARDLAEDQATPDNAGTANC